MPPMPSPHRAEADDARGRGGEAPAPKVVAASGRIRRGALDPDALSVVARLQSAGHEAYLVGGCVRDLLLGLEPKDFDVATDATPSRIRRLFRQAYVIGRRFRLVHVRFPDGKVVETSTFRREADPAPAPDGERDGPVHDENVYGTAAEDAFRRDFTVNALLYDPGRDVVVDHVGGLEDLEKRVIRSIGDPARRLCEDPVRMIRAVHFAARIGGTVEPSLLAAVRECADEIAKSSPSRLYLELVKILTRGCARPTLRGLYDLGVLHPWLPALCDFLDRPVEWPQAAGGTHEEAREGEPEDTPASHLTWNLLGAADAWGMASRGVPDGLALATLVGPWILETWERGPRLGPTLAIHAEETFRPLALLMSIPRRAAWEIREVLVMLQPLAHPPEAQKRARSLVVRPAFPEALAFLGLVLRARDHDLAVVDRWHAIADEVWAKEDAWRAARHGGGDDERDGDVPTGRRRRRRGGRGRSRAQAGDEPSEAPPPERVEPSPAPERREPPPPPAPTPPPPPSEGRVPFGAGL
jgi:poly(A) polymerase